MKKIAYLSQSALSDVDFSYMHEAQQIMDITYYILVSPSQRQKAAINLKSLDMKFGIIPATKIPELSFFSRIVDLKRVFVVNYTSTNGHQIRNLIESYKVYREIRDKQYDVVHITWPLGYFKPFLYLLRKKMVLTVHDPFPHSSSVRSMHEYERSKAFKNVNHLILLNEAQKKEFISHYHLDKPKKHIYQSRLSRYDYLHIHDNAIKETNPQQLLFFGQIFSHKGIDYLVKAMDMVHITHPNAKLVVAGSGKYYFDISMYRASEYVEILNRYIPDDELVSLITSSAFVVVPYIDATQSGVIMTAYAFDKPCIATNVGGLPEMVQDGKNGIIVAPKDSVGLAEAIRRLLDNPNEVANFSANIREQYKSGALSWKKISVDMKNIYDEIN